MSEEKIQLKGTNAGLQLIIPATLSIDAALAELGEKLSAPTGSRFFPAGTLVYLLPGKRTDEEAAQLKKLFSQYGVSFVVEDREAKLKEQLAAKQTANNAAPEPLAADTAYKEDEMSLMRVINRTVRGGESIMSRGGVLVIGNVNPGAEIIAGGTIDIRGTCRGLVHAGAFGDRSAVVIADRLMPVQIRIADIIAQSPENLAPPTKPERAMIKDNAIVVEPIERQA